MGNILQDDFCQEIFTEHSNSHKWISADEERLWNITGATVSVLAGKPFFDTIPMRIERVSSISGSCQLIGFSALHLTCTQSKHECL